MNKVRLPKKGVETISWRPRHQRLSPTPPKPVAAPTAKTPVVNEIYERQLREWAKETKDAQEPPSTIDEDQKKSPGLLESIPHEPGSKEWSDVVVNRLTMDD